ncbi:winged helix-turn-helix transcriptional regulator [Arthrobacter sp. HY1533]|uniref:winged helix-turn-helix transcriptional regulator n=1 Tax=Arthrobacter sp. HY1533 TaxID=2970919 RepID=UPI0022BA0C53|nr:helix-turn-helix domain-containing protein [Arthrobacter sp. HY1533]
MALRSDWSGQACPIARTLDVLGDPWVVLILREIFTGNRRFDTLKHSLGIADSVLSGRLAGLVEHGLLAKSAYAGAARPRVEYVLTEKGADTLPVLHALSLWGRKHTVPPEQGATMRFYCLECGNESHSADWCVDCARPLTVETTGWRRARSPEILLELRSAGR